MRLLEFCNFLSRMTSRAQCRGDGLHACKVVAPSTQLSTSRQWLVFWYWVLAQRLPTHCCKNLQLDDKCYTLHRIVKSLKMNWAKYVALFGGQQKCLQKFFTKVWMEGTIWYEQMYRMYTGVISLRCCPLARSCQLITSLGIVQKAGNVLTNWATDRSLRTILFVWSFCEIRRVNITRRMDRFHTCRSVAEHLPFKYNFFLRHAPLVHSSCHSK
jgi:hypothetical protein